jgi:hypothetical protein
MKYIFFKRFLTLLLFYYKEKVIFHVFQYLHWLVFQVRFGKGDVGLYQNDLY